MKHVFKATLETEELTEFEAAHVPGETGTELPARESRGQRSPEGRGRTLSKALRQWLSQELLREEETQFGLQHFSKPKGRALVPAVQSEASGQLQRLPASAEEALCEEIAEFVPINNEDKILPKL